MNKTGKYVSIFMWVLIVITAILAISLVANLSDNEQDPTMNSWVSTNLTWTYILMIFSAIALVGFAVYQMATDFEAAKKGLISIGFMGVVVLIAYMMASDAMPTFLGAQKFIDDETVTPKVMKWVDTGLIATYIVLGISVASIIYASVSRLFK
ncbi:MAG TPA: hypothetical protein DER09_03265 [Prolixibacteraceae bacterium]|nr:hypothetical protein [Prolixibacteraceae bacterium]